MLYVGVDFMVVWVTWLGCCFLVIVCFAGFVIWLMVVGIAVDIGVYYRGCGLFALVC